MGRPFGTVTASSAVLNYPCNIVLAVAYACAVYVAAGSVIDCIHTCNDLHAQLLRFSSFLIVVALPISIYHIWDHVTHFRKQRVQAHIVRIAWMVPIFCCESYLSLQFVAQATYFQAIRELYEAYVLHCFMRLMLDYLNDGGAGQSIASRLAAYPASMGAHKPPFCCLAPWQMGSEFVTKCKTGVFQYVVVRFVNTILSIVLFTLGIYEEGKYSVTKPFIWITAVNFVSQSWALYSLLLFFLCVHKELVGIRPFSKFLCIKLIIFTSWWQALLIGILVRLGRIHRGYGHSAQEIAVFIRCTLISAEMVVAALAFSFAFPVSEFISVGNGGAQGRRADSKGRMGGKGIMKLLAGYTTGRDKNSTTGKSNARQSKDGRSNKDVGASSRIEVDWDGEDDNHHAEEEELAGRSLLPLYASAAGRGQGDDNSAQNKVVSSVVPSATDPLRTASDESPAPSSSASSPRPLLPQQLRGNYSYGRSDEVVKSTTRPGSFALRASPSPLRKDLTPVNKTGIEFPSSPVGAFRRTGSITAGRAAESAGDLPRLAASFSRTDQALPEQCADSTGTPSECSHDEASTDTASGAEAEDRVTAVLPQFVHSTSLVRLLSDSSPPELQRPSRPRSHSAGGKSHRANDKMRANSPWLEALWTSALPADLQEDIGDLEAQLGELYTAIVPAAGQQFKRFMKTGATPAGRKMIV